MGLISIKKATAFPNWRYNITSKLPACPGAGGRGMRRAQPCAVPCQLTSFCSSSRLFTYRPVSTRTFEWMGYFNILTAQDILLTRDPSSFEFLYIEISDMAVFMSMT
jgi:hypothetical protein